jgi:serine/threonine protein kinase
MPCARAHIHLLPSPLSVIPILRRRWEFLKDSAHRGVLAFALMRDGRLLLRHLRLRPQVPKLNSEVCNSLRDHPDDENNPQLNGYFAIKQMKKTEVMRNKQTEHVRNESLIHYQTDHPFLTTLFYRFQDDRHLNLVMEYVQCGTVYNLIQKNGRLPNEVARFYAAQIVMAVRYLHGEHMIFRDLNPTNILLDRRLVRARRAHAVDARPATAPC